MGCEGDIRDVEFVEEDEETDKYYDYLMDRFANLVAGLYELDKKKLIELWSNPDASGRI